MSTDSPLVWAVLVPAAVTSGLVAVLFLVGSATRRRRDRLLATTGRRAVGRVLASGCDTDDLGSSTHWVKVEYSADGELITTRVVVSERDQQQLRVGQRVGLTYAPSRPGVVELD